jgi:hypothetical protein
MTFSDEHGYNVALADAGLAPDWVILGDNTIKETLKRKAIDNDPPLGTPYTYDFSGYPIPNPDMVVPNPKDLVTKGLGSIPELRQSISATYLEIVLGLYLSGSPMDAVEAYSTPVFMLMQAVDSMAQAKALGAKKEAADKKEREEKRKSFILLIVSVVLMVCGPLFVTHPRLSLTSRSRSFLLWVKRLRWRPDSSTSDARLPLLVRPGTPHTWSTIPCRIRTPLLSMSWACCLVLAQLPKLNAPARALATSLS